MLRDGPDGSYRFLPGITAFSLQQRLSALGGDWSRVTAIEVYTPQPIHGLVDDMLGPAGPAAIHGVRWFPSRPPIQGLEFEMDLRGVGRELVL